MRTHGSWKTILALIALSGCTSGEPKDTDTDIVEDTDVPPDTDVLDTDDTDDTDPVDTGEALPSDWTFVTSGVSGALLSVHGTAGDDVWAVGADKGKGPLVLHYDGVDWTPLATGTSGSLWWVRALSDGTTFFAGANGTLLRHDGTSFTRMTIPGLAKHLSFGAWASAADDLWVVGATQGRNGYVWRWDGSDWTELELPNGCPLDANNDLPQLFKVWGDGAGTVWVVGASGVVLRSVNDGPLELITSGTTDRLFTVDGQGSDVVAVGGNTEGVILEWNGTSFDKVAGTFPILQGVTVAPDGRAWATGADGRVFARSAAGVWAEETTGLVTDVDSLHAAWWSPGDGLWTVGGDTFSDLDSGAILHRGVAVTSWTEPVVPPPTAVCPANAIDPEPDRSIARRWNEQILNGIRRDLPRPGVHARNLYHLSLAMWDAWAAYDTIADGVLFDEKITSADIDADRDIAISYAAYRVLHHRYANAIGGPVTEACFDAFMGVLSLDPTDTHTNGDDAIAVGNRIGDLVITTFANDGANESANYADTTSWAATNPAMVVDKPGTNATDPMIWQQLVLAEAESQNGLPLAAGVQGYIGAQWKDVVPFALERAGAGLPYFDPDELPDLDGLVEQTVEMIEKESKLDPRFAATIDISPGAYGNNPLGTNDGTGHATNPVTGQPYAAQVVKLGDFARVLAEYWADGPKSETPPGHWNKIANEVSDAPGFERKLYGTGEELDELTWDVHMYLALDGAVHDAAIAAWEQKRTTLGPRPITLVRWFCQNGQRTDSGLPSYDEDGIELVDGLIELITSASSAPGQRHAHLARYEGEVAVLGWNGEPGDRANEVGGVSWIRCADWIPYQRRTFVTPAFPGFVSGHSTFSRAGAEVLAELTGSAYYPGGIGEFVANPGAYLIFEDGPSQTVKLQWGTYYDAADQAGQSRLWGGIHVVADDFGGRRIGHEVGLAALDKAATYFEGTAR